ncbi:DUF3363 domain-containing protein [Variovorax sp. LT1R16]|uniref:DUF3363 domain-containing protein n=1 Tax=Variovorax sp. LT1R16 TaxID=3443728 RepID=UPI003F45E334
MQKSTDFPVDQCLVERHGRPVILARNILTTLRWRAAAAAALDIAKATGLVHRQGADGERISGVYRRSAQLASGRFAMLDDGPGFGLVP